MTKDAREIGNALDLIATACEEIKDHDRCEDCPLSHVCLEDTSESFIDIADLISPLSWDEFLNYADNVTFKDEDLEAQHADFRRKYDIEERMMD